MKNKLRKKLFGALAIGTAMALTMPAVLSQAASNGKLVDRVQHTDLNFEDLTYTRMEEADFDAIVEDLDSILEADDMEDDVLDVIIGMEDYYNMMMGYYSLVNVYDSLYVDNEIYDEDVEYFSELATNIGDKILLNYQKIALSQYSDVLRERVDDEDEWQDILDYEALTDEQKELVAQQTELNLQFDEIYNTTYVTTIGSESYSMEDLEEAVSNQQIGIEDYLGGVADICTQRNEALGNLYIDLVHVRNRIAELKGYDNYADYAYEEIYDRDYSPEDLEAYRENVKQYIIPAYEELSSYVTEENYDRLMEVMQVEMDEETCLNNLEEHLGDISDDLYVSYNYMVDHHMYDIGIDDNKAPGGYTTTLNMYNAPFLFNCADGTFSDMGTLIHEFGHYNEAYYASEDEWYYGDSNLDIAEIHSQGMELLFNEYGEDIYGEYADIINAYNALNTAYILIEGCKEDAFQYAVYSLDDDEVTLERINELYHDVCEEYERLESYNSYFLGDMYGYMPNGQITEWVEIPHTFNSPMYYISYSVSQAAVEELRSVIMNDREEGIELYLDLVNAGFSMDFKETLAAFGMNDPISNPDCETYAENLLIFAGLHEAPVEEPDEEPDEEPEETGIVDGVCTTCGRAIDEEKPEPEVQIVEVEKELTFGESIKALPKSAFGITVMSVVGGLFVAVIALLVALLVNVNKNKKMKKQNAPAAPVSPKQMPLSGQTPMQQPTFTPVQNQNLSNQPTFAGSNNSAMQVPPAQPMSSLSPAQPMTMSNPSPAQPMTMSNPSPAQPMQMNAISPMAAAPVGVNKFAPQMAPMGPSGNKVEDTVKEQEEKAPEEAVKAEAKAEAAEENKAEEVKAETTEEKETVETKEEASKAEETTETEDATEEEKVEEASKEEEDEPKAEKTAEPKMVARFCTSCGAAVREDMLFCENCGAKIQ